MSRLLRAGNNRVTQTFVQHKGWAKGIDIVKYPAQLDDIVAHSNGRVIKVMTGQSNGSLDNEGFGYGNYIMIAHDNNIVTLYAHLDKVYVSVGQNVRKGGTIAHMGNTGNSFGAHLHFEVRAYNTNPLNILTKELNITKYFRWLDPTPYIDSDLPIGTKAKYKINGIDYSPVFDPEYYLNTYSDLKNAFGSDYNKAWEHFKQYGMKESRQAHKDFNIFVYRDNYEDLKRAFGSNIPAYYKHYCEYGKNEGRNAVMSLIEDYAKSTIPNRFKVKVNGVQKAAYTNYKSACNYANSIGGVVVDGNNGKQIYP